MLLVVWGHTLYFCMYHEQVNISDSLLSIICTFHVPLFFFLSGVVIATPPNFRKFISKARKFLVPMLLVGIVNAMLIGRVANFFLDSGHNGYWYLLTSICCSYPSAIAGICLTYHWPCLYGSWHTLPPGFKTPFSLR